MSKLLQKLLTLKPGRYKCVKQRVQKRLLLKDKVVDDILGYVFIDIDVSGFYLQTRSHIDHHNKLSDFPCALVFYNSNEIKSRAINYIGTYQQITTPLNGSVFDYQLEEVLENIVGLN